MQKKVQDVVTDGVLRVSENGVIQQKRSGRDGTVHTAHRSGPPILLLQNQLESIRVGCMDAWIAHQQRAVHRQPQPERVRIGYEGNDAQTSEEQCLRSEI